MTDKRKRKKPSKPNRKQLDEESVFNLPTRRGRQYRAWDSGRHSQRGLFVLVQPTGTRSYYVRYGFDGSPKEYTLRLGRVGPMKLAQARAAALAALQAAARGEDPAASQPAAIAGDTFATVVEAWTEDQLTAGYVSAELTKKLMLNATTRLHERPVATIRWLELKTLLANKAKSAPHTANRLHGHLGSLFNWLVTNEMLTVNPMRGKRLPDPVAADKSRDLPWFNSDDAIRKIWQAADTIGGDADKLLKLCLITGKRHGAIRAMQWEQIGEAWDWRTPKGSYTKRLNPIPLPRFAQRIMKPRGTGPVLGAVHVPTTLRRVRELTGIEDFIIHGLRHIVATKLKRLKVKRYVRLLLQDHAPIDDTQAGYEHDDDGDRDDMLAALELWCAELERLVSPAEGVAVLR
jgi:integrase